MRTTLWISLLLATLLALSPAAAQAKMLYYTFEGTYTYERIELAPNTADPQAVIDALVPDEMFRRGEAASYTFGIDLDRPGVMRNSAGELMEFPDSVYVEYLGGSTLTGHNPHVNGILGQFYKSTWSQLHVTANNTMINGSVFSLTEGSQAQFAELYYAFEEWPPGEDEYSAALYADTYLVAISSENPYATTATPIPGAVWLLGSGVVGLISLRRQTASFGYK